MELTEEQKQDLLEKIGNALKVIDLLGRFLDIRTITPEEINLAATAGTNDLKFDRVQPGRIQVITDFAAFDDTSSPTRVRLGYYNGHREQWHQGVPAPLTSEAVRFSGQLVLFEGQYPIARFEGATSGDDLYAFINGFEILVGPRW